MRTLLEELEDNYAKKHMDKHGLEDDFVFIPKLEGSEDHANIMENHHVREPVYSQV